MLRGTTGIYRITCVDKFYIGSAIDIEKRWQTHLRTMRNGKHINPIMQSMYNKFGENAFSIELLEVVEKDCLLQTEDRYIKENFGDENCMNLCESATAPMLNKTPWNKGLKNVLKHSDDTKELISKNNSRYWAGKTREDISEKFKGHEVGEEVREKIRSKLKGKPLTEETKEKMKGRVPWNKGKKGSQVPWNKGLSAKEDSRVAKNIENKIKSQKLKKETGLYEDSN